MGCCSITEQLQIIYLNNENVFKDYFIIEIDEKNFQSNCTLNPGILKNTKSIVNPHTDMYYGLYIISFNMFRLLINQSKK
jgi:hypothetical protein